MKPQFVFYFVDEPQYAAQDSRAATANLLRSWRAHPERYVLRREGAHRYSVGARHPFSGMHGPQCVAIVEPAKGAQ